MQYPAERVEVPRVDHVSKEIIQSLVDFHEYKYVWPERFSVIAHQVLAADNLGDDSFVEFISYELKVPVGRIDSSNTTQDVKMAIRDRLKLSDVVKLRKSKGDECYSCKSVFMERELTCVVQCCGRMFHCSCLLDIKICPFCNKAWITLPCTVCGKRTHDQKSRFFLNVTATTRQIGCHAVEWMSTPGVRKPSEAVAQAVGRTTSRERVITLVLFTAEEKPGAMKQSARRWQSGSPLTSFHHIMTGDCSSLI